MAPLATAFVEIRPETSNFKRDAERDFADAGKSAGQKFSEEYTKDATGRLRNAQGQFVKLHQDSGRRSGQIFGDSFLKTAGSKMVGGIKTPLVKVGNMASGIFEKFGLDATTAVGLAGAAAIGMGVKFDAGLEQAQAGFTTMLKSATKAKTFLDQLQKFAASTPFEFTDLVDASERMIAFGFDAKQVVPALTAIGDAAAGLGKGSEGVDQLINAIGQIKAKGKVQSDELLQLTEAGVPALRILANAYGVTTAKMQQMVTAGAVPASKAIPLLLGGLEKGTKGAAGATTAFAGLMQRQSQTLVGVWSNFVDVSNQKLGKLVAPALPFVKTALTGLTGLMSKGIGGALSGATQNRVIKALMALAVSIRTFITGSLLPSLRNIGTALAPTFHGIVSILTTLLIPAFRQLGSFLTGILGPALTSVTKFLADHKTILEAVFAAVAGGVAAYVALQAPMLVMTGIVRGVAVVTRLWAVAQAILNVAMDANPIGLIVIAIAALVGALVIAYQHSQTFRNIVQATWNGIKVAALAAWNYGLKFVFEAIKFYIMKILVPYYKFLWSVVKVVWSGIKLAIQAAWFVIRVYWALLVAEVKAIWKVFQLFWNITKPIWTAFGRLIKSVWDTTIHAAFSAIHAGLSAVQSAFRTSISAIGTIWNKLKSITKGPVSFMVNTVYMGGIRKVWEGVRGLVPGLPDLPSVHFATGGVFPGYTPGRDVHSMPMAAFSGGEAVMVPEFTRAVGSKFVYTANRIGRRGGPAAVRSWLTGGETFAGGGILGKIKDILGKPLDLAKHAGSYILQKGASAFAKGILQPVLSHIPHGNDLWSRAIFSLPEKLIGGFLSFIKNVVDPKLSGGGDPLGVVKAALKYVGQGDDRGMDNNNQFTRHWGWPPGTPWCALFVSTAIQDAHAQKHYRGYPTALAAGYDSMQNVGLGEGRAGDLATYNGGGHINIIEKPAPGGGYWTIGGNQNAVVQHSIRGGQGRILRPNAKGGITTAAWRRIWNYEWRRNFGGAHDAQNPLVQLFSRMPNQTGMGVGKSIVKGGVYDTGGVLRPGTFALNTSRKPEAVFTSEQLSVLAGAGGSKRAAVEFTGDIHIHDGADLDRLMKRAEFEARAAGFGGV